VSGAVVTPGHGRRAARQVGDWLPALVILVATIAVWPAGWYTFKEALGGFVAGSLAGMLFAAFVARFRAVGAALMPVAVAANAVPIIAFAPIFDVWFDPLSPYSKMAIAGVLCFFPVMVNTLRGLTSVQPRQIELMRAYAASDLQVFRRVRVPTALPFIFTSLKVASVLAMIGAIVGEYFGGSLDALGVQIQSDAQSFDFVTAWAGIVVASLFGISLYLAVVVSERLLVRWAPESRDS